MLENTRKNGFAQEQARPEDAPGRDNQIREAVIRVLRESNEAEEKENGLFEYELYASYDDRISDQEVVKILQSDDPEFAFTEKVEEAYWDEVCDIRDTFAARAAKTIYPKMSAEDDEDIFQTALQVVKELMEFTYPYDHYYKQEYKADITVDTGDMNYDFTLNSVYPAYYGQEGEMIEDRASLVWLAKSQGYTKRQLEAALAKGDVADPEGFLDSVRQEVANEVSHMNMLTFLARMTLRDMIHVNELIKKQEPDGETIFEADMRPDCGTIRIRKDAMTGLFNSEDGAGSCFEIELEKDIILPVKYIHTCMPDRYFRWCVAGVYDMCGSAWKDVVSEIKEPQEAA